MPDGAPRRRPATSVKVVVTGPFGVGKTTVIRTLSEIDVLTTERRVSMEAAEEDPQSTTVAMDFGRLTIDDDLQLFIFGTPGQRRFDFMWEILSEGMLGFVVMVDHHRPDSMAEAMEVLTWFRDRADVPYIIGVNKVPAGEEERAVRQTRHLLRLAPEVHVTTVDARDRESAKDLLVQLFIAAREHRARVAELRVAQGSSASSTSSAPTPAPEPA